MIGKILIAVLSFFSVSVHAQDSTFIKVHFLYGSKPLKKYKDVEPKWFGGILGGHVGIEGDNDQVVNFIFKGKFHWFAHKNNLHSTYVSQTVDRFYRVMRSDPDSLKKAVIVIPVSCEQKERFDSISNVYIRQVPYDYAFIGTRCSAAAYDLLSQINILPRYSHRKTYMKIFYPKKLRKRLLNKAEANDWIVERAEGTDRRKWEKD
jgi:hypothetical protein